MTDGARPTGPVTGGHAPSAARVRRLAARAAASYAAAAWLPRRVAAGLMEHLAPVRITPGRILDVGAGTGICTRLLEKRYRGARLVAIDSSRPMLEAARRGRWRWFTRQSFACGDAMALPIADASVDLVLSSLMLSSCPRPDSALSEFHRVLRPGGLLMLATLGPDTLTELRASWSAVDPWVHVHGFVDMHDLGDALLGAGFRDVVMDTDRIVARYRDVAALTDELRRLGCSNAAGGSRKGLTPPASAAAMTAAYETLRHDNAIPASYEIVYGHAWRAPSRRVEVSPDALLRRRPVT